MYSFAAAWSCFWVSDSLAYIVTIMVKSNVWYFQSTVRITRSSREWRSVCASPPDLGPNGSLITALEDDLATFFDNLFIWICPKIQSSVSFTWCDMAMQFVAMV